MRRPAGPGTDWRILAGPALLALAAMAVGYGTSWLPGWLHRGPEVSRAFPAEPPSEFVGRVADRARPGEEAERRRETREATETSPAASLAISRYVEARREGDPMVATQAAREFAALGDGAAPALRERVLFTPEPREVAVLLDLGGEAPGEGMFEALRGLPGRIPLGEAGVQESWVVAVSKVGGSRAVPWLAGALRDLPEGSETTAIEDGLRAVGSAGDASGLRQMAGSLQGERRERLLAVAEDLEGRAAASAPALAGDLDSLVRALRAETRGAGRIVLIKRIAALGTAQAASALAEYARTAQRTPALRDAALNAIDALCGMEGEGCREAFYGMFERSSDEWQIEAARLFRPRATAGDRAFLERWATDRAADPRVRRIFREMLENP